MVYRRPSVTGKRKPHSGYNAQRRVPEPARTNLITSDRSGHIGDFEIQEGQGDLRGYIVRPVQKWQDDLSHAPVMIFDRKGHGPCFSTALSMGGFLLWHQERHVDKNKLEAMDAECFDEKFEFSENTFKHLADRYPLHYQPGFAFVESKKQETAN